MYEEFFADRLAYLRNQKGISAREMSLMIGQNPGYINNIETGKALPSMSGFFYICEYLNITPQEFFDHNSAYPEETRLLCKDLQKLTVSQFKNIQDIVHDLSKGK